VARGSKDRGGEEDSGDVAHIGARSNLHHRVPCRARDHFLSNERAGANRFLQFLPFLQSFLLPRLLYPPAPPPLPAPPSLDTLQALPLDAPARLRGPMGGGTGSSQSLRVYTGGGGEGESPIGEVLVGGDTSVGEVRMV
jgi:hypothetical protein